ncbi:MAG: flippase-like domain-containing protein [Xanthomonadaceae bacterium]|nr:flippase-like domain-containing protein [Xanthomonadaceae bacterium]MDE2226081.1 flippase-like domain-containing protein [Xanthomonadaceae bacterium]
MTAGLIVTVLFVWYVVRTLRGHDLSAYATPRAALGILLAAILWSCGAPLLALAWRGMLIGLGIRRSRRELFAIIGITQFAKYIPGNVAQYIGRAGMSLARGIPARPLAVTIILETLLVIAAAVVMGVGTGALSDVGLQVVRRHGAQLTLIALLVVLAIAGLFVLRRAAPALLRRFAPRYAPVLDGTLLPSQTSLARAFLLYCGMYVVMGIGLILLSRFLLPDASHDYWLLIAVFALAWVVGFVTPGAPGGFGIREGLMLLMLAPVFSAASASVLVIALRVATTLGDVFILIAGFLLLPKRSDLSSTTPTPS